MHFAEDKAIFIVDREGFYPKLGSLTIGSGFAYGLGFRDRDLFENKGALDIWAAASIRSYWAAEARLTFPELAGRRLPLETWVSRRDYPQENFFGIGPDSNRGRPLGLRHPHRLLRRAGWRSAGCVALVGGGLEYLTPAGAAAGTTACRTWTDVFASDGRPGFATSADFLAERGFRRDRLSRAEERAGRADGTASTSPTTTTARPGRYTFNRVDADLRQFVGFLAGRRVLAAATLRLDVGHRRRRSGDAVLSACPRSAATIRCAGFAIPLPRTARDPAQAEYRWEIWSGLDAALFYDAGKVADRRADLDFTDLETRLWLRVPLQHQQRRSSSASMPPSGAVMASTSTSSSAALLRRSRVRPCASAIVRWRCVSLAVAGARVWSRRRGSIRTIRSGPTTTGRSTRRRSAPIEDTNGYDFVVNTFGKPGERRDVRALNVNTVDEVPDSSWFTNRIGRRG